MRSCLLSLLVAVLIAANGYAIWQIQLIRADLSKLIREAGLEQEAERHSMLDCARNAAEAIGRGEVDRAQAELDRLRGMLQDAGEMTEARRERLIEQLEAVKQAVSRGSERAKEEIDDLVQMLSGKSQPEDS